RPFQAALAGAEQIGVTIGSITASLIAVFIPILLMGGIVGRLFPEFAVALSVAIVLSAVGSLTRAATMAAHLLRPVEEEHPTRFQRAAERAFDRLVRGYDRALGWVLDHALLMQLLTVATLGVTLALAFLIPKGLFPQQDTGMLAGFTQAP